MFSAGVDAPWACKHIKQKVAYSDLFIFTKGDSRNGPVDKSAIGYSMELRPMALRDLRRLTPGCFRVVRSFTIRFRFNAVAERRQCS